MTTGIHRRTFCAACSVAPHAPPTSSLLFSPVAWVLAGLVLGWIYLPQLQAALAPTGLTAPVLAVLGLIFFTPSSFSTCSRIWHGARRNCGSSPSPWPRSPCDWRSRRRWRASPSSPSDRRSGAKLRPWATASSARSRARPSSRRWSPTKSPRSNTPITTTRCASARLLQDLGGQRDTLVGQAEQIRDAINSVHLDLEPRIFRRSASSLPNRSTRLRGESPTRLAEKGEHITRALEHAGDTMIAARWASAAAICSSGWKAPAGRPRRRLRARATG